MFEENNVNCSGENSPEQNPAPEFINPTEYVPYGFTPETYREKKDIRRLARIIGIPLLCITAIGILWSFVYWYVALNILRVDYDSALVFARDSGVQQVLQIFLSCLMFLVPFTIAAKASGHRIDSLVSLKTKKKGIALPLVMFGIGFCAFANIAMSYADAWFSMFGIEYEVDFGENPSGIFGFLLSFIATAIVPALVEEFACRGIVIGLLKKYGETFALITSAVVFGIMHGNFEQIPFAILVGLILGYIYLKTQNLWISIAVHAANNAVSVILSYLESIVDVNAQNLIYLVYLMVAMLLAILSILLLSKSKDFTYSLENSKSACSERQKYLWFGTSVFTIIFISANLLEAFSYFIV